MADTPTTERRCCHLSCTSEAEFEIVTVRDAGVVAGPDPYSDSTDACAAHVGALLGHQPDVINPGEIYWEVHCA